MKKVLLTILVVLLILGGLAGAGFAGYRIGYRQGAAANLTGGTAPFMHDFRFGLQGMPMHNFGRDFGPDFNRGFGMPGRGMGFFSPFMFLGFAGRIVFWGLILWFAYWLFTRSGWQLTRTQQPAATPKVEAAEPEQKAE